MMHVRRTVLAVLFVCVTAIGGAQGDANQQLLSISPTWESHYNGADLDALATLYTSDVVLMPPDAPAATGLDAMRAIVTGYLDAGLVRSEIPPLDAYGVSGDLAWGAGAYRFLSADDTVQAEGKYLIVYRLVDGTWKIARHMWSSDAPPPQP